VNRPFRARLRLDRLEEATVTHMLGLKVFRCQTLHFCSLWGVHFHVQRQRCVRGACQHGWTDERLEVEILNGRVALRLLVTLTRS